MTLPRIITLAFVALIAGVPLGQAAWEVSRGERVQALDVFGPIDEGRLRRFEDDLRRSSFLDATFIPHYQHALTRLFGRGNERAIEGLDGWLFYDDDLALITEHGIMRTDGAGPRALEAITGFRDQLRERGVELILLPVPSKSMTDPAYLSRWTRDLAFVGNPDTQAFFDELTARGIEWIDLMGFFADLREQRGDPLSPLYLPRETHWTPEIVELVADEIASRVTNLVGDELTRAATYTSEGGRVEAAGDILAMLRLPEGVTVFDDMRMDVNRVRNAGEPGFTFDEGAEILMLGDSFTLVYSDERLGLGERAGLGEHVALALQRPVDVIAVPAGSATRVREILSRRERGLAGKKALVWQISFRDLLGDGSVWENIDFDDEPASPDDTNPPAPAELRVIAEVREVSRIPEGFVYDLCLAVYEYRIVEVLSGPDDLRSEPLWVAHAAIRDFESTPEAAFDVGDRHRLTLQPIELHHDLERTAWVDDTDAGRTIHWAVSWEDD